jgi:hypothetical protein
VTDGSGWRRWRGEELRSAALEALGGLADARAVDALSRGELTVEHAAARWDTSAGPVEAHRVTLAVDARCLGTLRAAPGVFDAVCAAVAAAIAARPGESLLELSLRWAPGTRAVARGYRDAPPAPVTLREGLVEYLDAAGERAAADVVGAAELRHDDPSQVVLLLDAPAWDTHRAHARALAATLTQATRDLLAPSGPRVRVVARTDRAR